MRRILILGLLFVSVLSYGQRYSMPNSGHIFTVNESSNMIYNGTFEDSTNYQLSGNLSIDGGVLSYDNTGSISSVCSTQELSESMVASTGYTISFDVVSISPGLYIYIQSTANELLISADNYTTGSYSLDFTTPSELVSGYLRIKVWGDADGTIDNLKLEKQ